MLIAEIAAGLVLLLLGGEFLVRGAVAVARRLDVSPLLIGLTLVGFGTSTPELVASLEAALAGAPGIALGNIVGSNIANVLLILGLAALVAPMATDARAFRRDGPVLLGASALLILACLGGTLGRWPGLAFLALLAAYTAATYVSERRRPTPATALHGAEAELVAPAGWPLWRGLAVALAGLAGVLIGASLLVDGAIALAHRIGVPDTLIGLTLVAVGTSLPELATSLVAAARRQGAVAFGNIVGSNIFNILGIAGVTAVVRPLPVPPELLGRDLWVMLAATLVFAAFAMTGHRVARWEGALLLAGYGGYMAALAAGAP